MNDASYSGKPFLFQFVEAFMYTLILISQGLWRYREWNDSAIAFRKGYNILLWTVEKRAEEGKVYIVEVKVNHWSKTDWKEKIKDRHFRNLTGNQINIKVVFFFLFIFFFIAKTSSLNLITISDCVVWDQFSHRKLLSAEPCWWPLFKHPIQIQIE